MSSIWLALILLLAGFAILIKGADFIVKGASALALHLSVSEMTIALTVVAFGTSSPELVVNTIASVNGNNDAAFGNIVGSNIANILLILGISGIIYPITSGKDTVWREIPFAFLAAVIAMIMFNDDLLDHTGANLSRSEGLILLCIFVVYLVYVFGMSRIIVAEKPEFETLSVPRSVLNVVVALVMLVLGGKLVVDNALSLAGYIGISEKVAGLTILAVGTSLPELATSAVAAYRHKSEIAIGNVVGSNIFNIFFILGLSALIRPIPAPAAYNTDLVVLIVASGLLFLIMFTGRKRTLDRWEAWIFLGLYTAYIAALILWQ
jgi:cation:H+ antiporter